MPSLVVPFRGAEGKSRLGPLPVTARAALARAMLADVVSECTAVGPTYVVAPATTRAQGAVHVLDPGGGLGAAVRAGLEVAALAAGAAGPLLVVNSDLACVTARDLLALAGAVPAGGSRARRGGRRNDERARLRGARPLPAALRAGQRGTLRRSRLPRAGWTRRT